MTKEFKIQKYKNHLQKCSSLTQINAVMFRAERLGIEEAIELRNERASQINFKKSNFGFKLG